MLSMLNSTQFNPLLRAISSRVITVSWLCWSCMAQLYKNAMWKYLAVETIACPVPPFVIRRGAAQVLRKQLLIL